MWNFIVSLKERSNLHMFKLFDFRSLPDESISRSKRSADSLSANAGKMPALPQHFDLLSIAKKPNACYFWRADTAIPIMKMLW
jgi:hypothetical protein